MMSINKSITLSVLFVLLIGFTSCNDWLDVKPDNEQTSDMYWNTKEEVEATVMAGYTGLKSSVESMINWGELRGDALDIDPVKGSSYISIKEMRIEPFMAVCRWSSFYDAIGNANSVLKYAPTVIEKDLTLSKELLNSYLAEAIFIRSLSYFYLIRTFRDVPLVLEPYVDDSNDFFTSKSSEQEVLKQIVTDLNAYVDKCKPGYGVDWQNKGRATKWAYYALLADIYLWQGDYPNCIQACNSIIQSNNYELLKRDEWYTLFNPGNSDEGIFEIQWMSEFSQESNLYSKFYSDSPFLLSTVTEKLFNELTEDDYRGIGVTYLEDRRIWKYAGTDIVSNEGEERSNGKRDANWIVYRYADILLLKAEALVMTGEFEQARLIVDDIRERAGYTKPLADPVTEFEGIKIVLEERHREFVGEGKRWFDILRVGRRNDYTTYREYMVDILLANVSAKDRAVFMAKLSDTNGYYLPIYEGEIEASGGRLEQNPFYDDKKQ